MELPDIKHEANKNLDSLKGTILGIVQIVVDDKGNLAICIGGIPDVIVKTLAGVMEKNHQIRDLFEAALLWGHCSPCDN